jgi:hypothetical protein
MVSKNDTEPRLQNQMSPNPYEVTTIPATDRSPEEKLYQGHNGIVGEV